MDQHSITLVIGIALIGIGAFMAFYETHYSASIWKPTGLSKGVSPETAKRLARFQGLLFILMGVAFILDIPGWLLMLLGVCLIVLLWLLGK